MKQFTKPMQKNEDFFRYLCDKYPGLPEAELKECVIFRPDIRKLMNHKLFLD